MSQSQKPWLGSFIASELEAMIKWKESSRYAPYVKEDPDCRFSDDGSNFRCVVGSPPLPADSRVQLLKVISPARESAVVLLSDGACSIKATLSEEALATLEDELGEKLSVEVKGDVFLIRSATLVSTPYGPEDGHIQLYIDELQYQFNLRRTPHGLPPVAQHDDVRGLFHQISQIRYRQYAELDSVGDVVSGGPQLDADTPKAAYREGESLPVSGLVPSPLPLTGSSPTAVATQVPPPRKKRRMTPSLAQDGFAIETGVNLALPSGPLSSATRQDDMRNALPNLRKLLQNQNQNCASLSHPRDLTVVLDNIDQPDFRNERIMRKSSPPISRPFPAALKQIATLHGSVQNSIQSEDISSFRLRYGRRKPPTSQQRLLDQESSWFPPGAGKQFPVPNLPIELLENWSSEGPTLVADALRSESSQVGGKQYSTECEPVTRTEDSDSSSQTSSSEEELSWSQSPSQRKEDYLPPDSTTNSGLRLADYEIHVQRRPSIQSPSRHEQSPDKSDVRGQRLAERKEEFKESPAWPSTALSNNPKQLPRNKAWDSASQRPSPTSHSKVSTTLSGNPFDGGHHNFSESGANDLPYRSPARHQQTSVNPFVPCSKIDMAIDGKKLSCDDDEMEIDVPRAYRDPAKFHRQKRSEHFKRAQREAWLRANWVVHSQTGPYIGKVYEAYHNEFPNDDIRPAEFRDLMKELFPALCNPSRPSLVPKLSGTDTPVLHAVRALSRQFDGSNEANDARPSDSMKRNPPGSFVTDGNATYANQSAHHGKLDLTRQQIAPLVRQPHSEGAVASSVANKSQQSSSKVYNFSTGTIVPKPEDTPFVEFAAAWRNAEPGGAFAGRQSPRKSSPHKIDVLAWLT